VSDTGLVRQKQCRRMSTGEYRKLRYAGGKPSLQQLKKWIEEGGHADVKMSEHYQAGHSDDAVVYMKVKADLKV